MSLSWSARKYQYFIYKYVCIFENRFIYTPAFLYLLKLFGISMCAERVLCVNSLSNIKLNGLRHTFVKNQTIPEQTDFHYIFDLNHTKSISGQSC